MTAWLQAWVRYAVLSGGNFLILSLAERGDGLYALDSKALAALQPDVVVTQDLCAVCAVDLKAVQRCAGSARVVSLNPLTLRDVLDDILRCGEAMGTQEQAQAAVSALEARIDRATAAAKQHSNGHGLKVRKWLYAL